MTSIFNDNKIDTEALRLMLNEIIGVMLSVPSPDDEESEKKYKEKSEKVLKDLCLYVREKEIGETSVSLSDYEFRLFLTGVVTGQAIQQVADNLITRSLENILKK